MKKIYVLCLLWVGLSWSSWAQTADEKQVAAAVEIFKNALTTADKKLLESITADELSYGHSSGKVEDKAAFVNGVLNDPIKFNIIDLQDQTIRVAGNTALVRHAFNAKITNNGTPGEIKIRNLLVWQKQKGQWKLLARQAFKVP
ncbi:nuclear transport factor 2 family protein [Adhaeribacter radiodurans]|uniref:Nuclear transport factor 2 family protein n=1 Tax=Adhaeribacter radiodurans TaxID=2745197 RepID=A0A7L7L516_9BACT|nr:nuclear transport factor 2 family protein [Adhaeribacter radiodurans]QMU27479.1 nuclear transport factor 2 family protein [Adhaeribacter radiodurans]